MSTETAAFGSSESRFGFLANSGDKHKVGGAKKFVSATKEYFIFGE